MFDQLSKELIMKHHYLFYTLAVSLMLAVVASPALEVKITPEIESVKVIHNGKEVLIMRNQDQNNTLNPDYMKTSRPCPTYCIKPIKLAPGVETVGELEVLDYLKRMSEGDNSILVIDSRTPEWVVKGSIPGAVNIPWDVLGINAKTESPYVKKVLEKQSEEVCSSPIIRKILEEQFGVKVSDLGKGFENAKTLVLFCNGPWCKRSPANIMTLLEIGYPPEKLKWYRGGMQAWELFGLTTVKDIPMPWLGL